MKRPWIFALFIQLAVALPLFAQSTTDSTAMDLESKMRLPAGSKPVSTNPEMRKTDRVFEYKVFTVSATVSDDVGYLGRFTHFVDVEELQTMLDRFSKQGWILDTITQVQIPSMIEIEREDHKGAIDLVVVMRR